MPNTTLDPLSASPFYITITILRGTRYEVTEIRAVNIPGILL